MSCPPVDACVEPAQAGKVVPDAVVAKLLHRHGVEARIHADFEEQGKVDLLQVELLCFRIGGFRGEEAAQDWNELNANSQGTSKIETDPRPFYFANMFPHADTADECVVKA